MTLDAETFFILKDSVRRFVQKRLLRRYEGTSQIQQVIIAKNLQGGV